jgi:hypothetical protein
MQRFLLTAFQPRVSESVEGVSLPASRVRNQGFCATVVLSYRELRRKGGVVSSNLGVCASARATVVFHESSRSSSPAHEREVQMKSSVNVVATIKAKIVCAVITIAAVASCMQGYGDRLFPSV